MKAALKLVVLLVFVLLLHLTSIAQTKVGWINSAAIMDKYPEARDAQSQIDNLVTDWQNELAKMQNEWQRKYEEYNKQKLILTDEQRAARESELQELDKRIAEYRQKKFGQSGELFTKQNDLMKPIQNKIFKILEEVAKEEGYDYIFDKSGDILLMYTNDKYDLTMKVLQRLTAFGK